MSILLLFLWKIYDRCVDTIFDEHLNSEENRYTYKIPSKLTSPNTLALEWMTIRLYVAFQCIDYVYPYIYDFIGLSLLK